MNVTEKRLTVLGSTGSVGVNTLDVVRKNPQFSIYALTANTNHQLMTQQCLEFAPAYAVMTDADAAQQLRQALQSAGSETVVLGGVEAQSQVASAAEVDAVMAAIVGAVGMLPALAAASSGKLVLLANKEALVMAGELFMQAARESQATILPIDSEHNAIFQCLPASAQQGEAKLLKAGIRKVILTASGGPFLSADTSQLDRVTPEQACKHPNWSMGRKISVDSATMMNKGLEFIEACYLFDLAPDRVDVLVHPQSIVHSMVEYEDGSVLAQLGSPDMRVPIAHALGWPSRISSGASFLDLAAGPDLQFMRPDMTRFPCLELGIEAAKRGGASPAVLNAANEVAVAAFLGRRVAFTDISRIIAATLEQITCRGPVSLAMIQEMDTQARSVAGELVATLQRRSRTA